MKTGQAEQGGKQRTAFQGKNREENRGQHERFNSEKAGEQEGQ